MLLKRTVVKKEDGSEDVVEAIFDSTNLLKTVYLPDYKLLYIFFKKGIVYKYNTVDREMYNGLEIAESQGVYHRQHLANNKLYPYTREFKMLNFEINNINEVIELAKKQLNESKLDERQHDTGTTGTDQKST